MANVNITEPPILDSTLQNVVTALNEISETKANTVSFDAVSKQLDDIGSHISDLSNTIDELAATVSALAEQISKS